MDAHTVAALIEWIFPAVLILVVLPLLCWLDPKGLMAEHLATLAAERAAATTTPED